MFNPTTGTRAELNFVAANPAAPLVAVISGIETEGSDDAPPDPPSERELDELYLTCAGWEAIRLDGLGVLWQDPLSGGAYCFADALQSQDRREELESKSNAIR